MKKFIGIVIVMVIILTSAVSIFASNNADEMKFYATTQYDKEWKEFTKKEEMVKSCKIDRNILEKMTTKELVKAVMDYPLLINVFAYDTYKSGLEALEKDSDAFIELLKRHDSGLELSKMFKEIDKSKNEKSQYQKLVISILLSEESIWEEIDDKTAVSKLLEESSMITSTERISKAYSSTIKTPKGSLVPVIVRGEELDGWLVVAINNQYKAAYPRATFIGNSTTNYNCHSYAWYLQSLTNKNWMNNPSLYMSDGSYRQITSLLEATVGTKVFYVTSHSAVVTTNSGPISHVGSLRVTSKWGQGPLMAHTVDYSPYNSSNITLWK